ncbi:uncharacterized protein LACBIDRAFT_307872 [Laccaria bicolor S238N-H82]|uniref:Predicted protein n=1 Tax=Laccaria bicolor (strain S238N-H82 / ATCC MYA-4686) TaxID=486041 RepID=B0DQW5_LACBS|nr:uncharacterized protein LACBIDRAFT_307872 [Laccaria bicolor S238N-H82]EDR02958.1 predicted protein [Laccaria bicolor S238N-H82]|eukprot:XP_001886381.1 predicted protein [Laccaria bicolor S238N-H82]
MRGRSGAKKIKNNLLAGVLVLIVIPSTVKLSRSAVEHCCFLISQKLLDVDGTSLTAAHCTKTLVASASAGNPTLRQCVRLLIPALVEFIAKMAPQAHEGSITEPQAAAIIGETCKAFSISSTLCTCLGCLITLLLVSNGASTQALSAPISTQAMTQLLTYAMASRAGFEEAAGKLDPAMRELLEKSIRRALGGVQGTQAQQAVKSQISLRSF